MTSISQADGRRSRAGSWSWPIWALAARLRWLIVSVVLTAALLIGVALRAQPLLTPDELRAAVIVGGLGILHTEISRPVERLRWRLMSGDVHVDLTSVWVFAAAILLPRGYAALLAVVVHTYLRLRSGRTRTPLHQQVFSTATIVLSCLAAATVMGQFRSALAPLGDATAVGGSETLGLLVFLVLNSALVACVIAMSSAGATAADLLGTWDENLVEIAGLSLGAALAIVFPINPWLVAFVLAPLLVVQRAALVRHLEEAASRDAKTGLLNSGAWHSAANRQLKRPRHGRLQAVLVLDLDHFKNVNDRHGHLAGDQVLAAVAATVRHEVRDGDVVGRFGGEEFVVLLTGEPRGTPRDLELVAERLRAGVAGLSVEVPTPDGPLTIDGLTVSVGGAVRGDREGGSLTTLLEIADRALYDVKRAGRNQVRMGPP